MPKQVFIESRNKTLEFPDEATQDQINDAVTAMFPPTGEDMAKYVDNLKNATIEGESFINPFDRTQKGSLSLDNYVLYKQDQAKKKTSMGEAFGIAKDTFNQVRDELGTAIGTGIYKTYQGEGVEVADSLHQGMQAGMVGTYDILNKIFDPAQPIPRKEDFVGKVAKPSYTSNAFMGMGGMLPTETSQDRVNTEEDYNRLVESEMQRDADAVDRLYTMESIMRNASIPEVARGAQFADPMLAAGLGGSLVKVALKGTKTLFTKSALKTATQSAARVAGTEGVESATEAAARTAAQGVDNIPPTSPDAINIESGGTIPFTPDPNAPMAATQGVPMMVTRDMKQQLLDRGFTGSQIDSMRPQEAWDLLNAESAAARSVTPSPFPSTAPNPMAQAGLRAAENTAGAIQFTAGLPSQGIKKLGEFVESVAPGMGTAAQGTVLGGSVVTVAPAVFLAKAKATEKVAEFFRSFARVSMEEASRAGRLERVALDPYTSLPVRKAAQTLAQFQPIARTVIDLSKGAAKGAVGGAVVGGVLGGLAEQSLEGAAAGAGGGFAMGGFYGSLNAGFDIGKEAFGGSTPRTRRNATGDINRFIASRPELEQAGWIDAMRTLVNKIGPERAASQMDALRVAEASGVKLRIATPDENKLWKAPGWLDPDKGELVLNPPRIQADTPAHEATHQILASNVKRQYRSQIEEAIYGIPDPVTGEIVKAGFLDDAGLIKIAEQIRDAYRRGDQKIAADRFQGLANNLKNSTDKESIMKARSAIADEMAADYGGKFFDRVRAGRFNPDRLPLVYRNALNAIDDGIFNTFKSVVYERGMDLGFDNTIKSFRDAKGKPIRVPQLDEIFKRAYSQKSNAESVVSKKPDLIPVKPADRAIWARTHGGARGILNEDNTPKSMAQLDAEATARWQNMTNRLAPLPESERKGIEFSRDKSGKTTMTAQGQLSPAALTAILESDMLDASANAVLRDVIISMQDPNKSTFDTRYYKVYERGKGNGKMVAGVYPPSQNEILPYKVTMNSEQGVNIHAVDMTKVRQRLATAMNKPQFKDLYNNPTDALKDFKRYLENMTQVGTPEKVSALLLGGGETGAAKRNLFYDALGFRLRNNESLLNVPDSVIRKSDTLKSYRVERFTKLVDTGFKFPFEEGTTFERGMKNFQPSAFTPETLPNGESFTNPDGYRILNKAGSKLFRTYDDTGKLIGIAESKEKAMKKAQDEFAKKAMKEEPANIRFQFAGEAAEMPKFMRDSLESAKAMAKEGKDSETIRAITGWFPGKYDDKMRWEVPDQNALIKTAVAASDGVYDGTLNEALAHQELFKAYPELKDLSVRITIDPSRTPSGRFVRSSMNGERLDSASQITVTAPNYESAKSTLLHEVQHWIQDKEGFAKGSSPEQFYSGRGTIRGDTLTPEAQRIMDSALIDPSMKMPPEEVRFRQSAATQEAYRRTAGEIESRDIQARQSFTPEQRKAIAPYSSENIAKDEAIVLKSASKSPTEMRFQPVTPEEFKAQVDAGYKDALTKVASISDDYLRKVADTFIKIAKKPEAFIANKQSKSKNVQEIVKDLGVLKTPQKEGIIVDDLGYLSVPRVGGANVIRLKTNEGMTHIFHSSGYVWADLSLATNKDASGKSVNAYINPLKRSKNDLGQATYQTMGLFAKNNGFKLIPDPNGVSEVASIRRVDAMLAAALRTGDTSFIDIDIPGWTKGKDFKKDVGLLASLSAEYVAHFFPQINDLKISKDGTKVIYNGKSFTPKEFEKSLFIEGKTPVETTVGEKTLRRALLAKLNTMGIEGKDMAGLLDDGVQPMRDNQQTSITSSVDDKTRALFAQSIGTKIMFQPDPTSPNILNGSNASRIIKSTSGKYRVYLATGALAGVKDTLESAQKLVEAKSNK